MEGEAKAHVSKEHKTSHSKPSTHVKKRSKSKKSKHEKHKRKRRSSSTSSSFDTSATTLSKERKRKKKKRYRSSSSSSDSHDKKHNKKKKMKKKKKKKYLEAKEVDTVTKGTSSRNIVEETKNEIIETGKKRPMVPMTKEEFERQQSIVRRVCDPETGRNRLIKGDGEVIEEIVSKTRHKEINKMSTLHDGQYFASSIGLNKR